MRIPGILEGGNAEVRRLFITISNVDSRKQWNQMLDFGAFRVQCHSQNNMMESANETGLCSLLTIPIAST